MITIKELLNYSQNYIVISQAEAILCNLLKMNSFELINSQEQIIRKDIVEEFINRVNKLQITQQLTSVIPSINFCDLNFKLTNEVLLPHFETQEIVLETIKYINQLFDKNANVIDLGCGSGVIGLTLKERCKNLKVDLIDISEEALNTTRENAKLLNIDANIFKSNMFSNVVDKYNIIISNPPYKEESFIPIINTEPKLALCAKNNGLYYYEEILKNIKYYLKDQFMIIFEFGKFQKEDVTKLVQKYLPNVGITSLKSQKGFNKSLYIFGGFEKEELQEKIKKKVKYYK